MSIKINRLEEGHNMGVSDDHGYVPFIVDTQSQYLSSFLDQNQRWLITGYFTWVTRRAQIVEQELLIFAEYLGSSWFIVVFLLLNLYISVFCAALTTACCFVLMINELAVLYWVPSLLASNHSYAIFHNFEARCLLNFVMLFCFSFTKLM
jgi:hypothetical protein